MPQSIDVSLDNLNGTSFGSGYETTKSSRVPTPYFDIKVCETKVFCLANIYIKIGPGDEANCLYAPQLCNSVIYL